MQRLGAHVSSIQVSLLAKGGLAGMARARAGEKPLYPLSLDGLSFFAEFSQQLKCANQRLLNRGRIVSHLAEGRVNV